MRATLNAKTRLHDNEKKNFGEAEGLIAAGAPEPVVFPALARRPFPIHVMTLLARQLEHCVILARRKTRRMGEPGVTLRDAAGLPAPTLDHCRQPRKHRGAARNALRRSVVQIWWQGASELQASLYLLLA